MHIRDWPAGERPREKLLSNGPCGLSDAELLAICLRTGVRGRSAIDLAHGLLADHGGLRGLLRANPDDLLATKGLGPAKYAQIVATTEITRRQMAQQLAEPEALRDPSDAVDYLRARLRDLHEERFVALFLDTRHRVIACEDLARGTIDAASVYPREVVKRTLALHAAAVIFAHNHPSGVAEPSAADRTLTTRLRDALALIDVRVLDHIIVGDPECVSMASRGMF